MDIRVVLVQPDCQNCWGKGTGARIWQSHSIAADGTDSCRWGRSSKYHALHQHNSPQMYNGHSHNILGSLISEAVLYFVADVFFSTWPATFLFLLLQLFQCICSELYRLLLCVLGCPALQASHAECITLALCSLLQVSAAELPC